MIIYRNVIVLEILSQDNKVEGADVLSFYEPAIGGDQSATVISEDFALVDEASAARLLVMQGSDPGFFGIEDDTKAIEAIHKIMDGTEWSSDTLDAIGHVITSTQREIRPPE